MKILLSVSLYVIVLTGCHAQMTKNELKKNKDDNSLLWQVSGKGLKKPSYLFGTFHLMCREDINFSSQLKKAIELCDEVYMELDMDDPSTMLSGLLFMNMKNGKTLKDLYSAEDYKRIETYFTDTLHTPLLMFQKAKPYFLVALLYPKMMPCNTPTGIEEELMKIIKQDKKEIQGLETMQFQASVFDSIPYEWQAKELIKNIDSASFYKNQFETITQVYKNQLLDSIGALLNKSEFGNDTYEDILLNKRNKNWVEQLKTIMKKESVFVAVGAGHLTGEKGLINLLRKEGYMVEPLFNR